MEHSSYRNKQNHFEKKKQDNLVKTLQLKQLDVGNYTNGFIRASVLSYLLTYLLTSLLTLLILLACLRASWFRIFFEKLTVTQLVKKYPAFVMEPKGSL
jgi:hypothetical protein